jgi:hypothetical protein
MSSLATKICSLLLPINLSLQLDNALAVAESLATNRLKGFMIGGVEAQASSTVSRKPSALGQKDSKRNLFPELNCRARFRRSGQWSEVEVLMADRKAEGKDPSQSTMEKTLSSRVSLDR